MSAQNLPPIESGKEPWLAVNLSLLCPGIGQIYAGRLVRGWILLISQLAIQLCGLLSLTLSEGNVMVGIGLFGLSFVISIGNLFDAYGCAKASNSLAFEQSRKSSKDPWLAVFLTRFIPGLGFLYIRKWVLGILLFIFTFLTLVFPLLSILNFLVLPFVVFLVYKIAPIRRERKYIAIILVCLFPVFTLFLALILALIIRGFVAEARYIPSGAMEPSLQVNDRLIIDKLSYQFTDPERGDIVVFNPTQTLRTQGFEDAFIKRIVGIPGDQVEVKSGAVFINNKILQEPYVANGDDTIVDSECIIPPDQSLPSFLREPQTIPEGSYLVLGDNRHNSYDGRCWGLILRSDIIGRATKRFWPPERIGLIESGR